MSRRRDAMLTGAIFLALALGELCFNWNRFAGRERTSGLWLDVLSIVVLVHAAVPCFLWRRKPSLALVRQFEFHDFFLR